MNKGSSYLSIFSIIICITAIRGHPSQEETGKGASYSSAREKRAAEELKKGFSEKIPSTSTGRLGPHFWKVIEDKLVPDYPKLISDHWIGLPDDLDAAFTLKNNQIYFFKGSKYWKFNGTKLNDGYPKEIKEGFPGIPNNIQAVTAYGPREYIYFFKGNQYWRYNPNREPRVNKNYPKLIHEVWEGIPDNLDEALVQRNGVIYFVKGLRYWSFEDEAFKDNFGRYTTFSALTGPDWFDCKLQP